MNVLGGKVGVHMKGTVVVGRFESRHECEFGSGGKTLGAEDNELTRRYISPESLVTV